MGIKITDLTALATAPNTADVIAIVDVSDTTQALSGTTKKITIADLGFLSSGDNITELTNNAGYITSSDFSNGGELAGANRDLGNTDAFALSFITNGVGRINIEAGGNVGIGTTTPTQKLEVAGNAKFSGTTYLNSSSIIGQTDNGDLAVGSNGNIGFVKKSGSFGVMAVGSTSNFVVRVSSSSNLAGTTAASTFTDIYHQENDTNVRIGRNDIAFRVDDDNGGVDPLDTLAQFQINTRSKTSITVDTLGRTTLGGTTANAEVILNTNDSTAIAAGLMVKNITGAQILALTPSNGMIAYATSTSGAISSVGFWGYENGAWVKL